MPTSKLPKGTLPELDDAFRELLHDDTTPPHAPLPEEVAELQRLYNAATPGEWWVDEEGTTIRLPGGDYIGDFDETQDRDLCVAMHNAFSAILSHLAAQARQIEELRLKADREHEARYALTEECCTGCPRIEQSEAKSVRLCRSMLRIGKRLRKARVTLAAAEAERDEHQQAACTATASLLIVEAERDALRWLVEVQDYQTHRIRCAGE